MDPLSTASLDLLLTTQFAVAWAGESGENPRLGWWRSDLISEFGGEDLFQRLLPSTWRWAVLQAVREAARRRDAELRAKDHTPDRLVTLFNLGFEKDERVAERLADLKRSGQEPKVALPGLVELLDQPWSAEAFTDWVQGHGQVRHVKDPAGRRIQGEPPANLDLLTRQLVRALAPLGENYPMPHFRRPI